MQRFYVPFTAVQVAAFLRVKAVKGTIAAALTGTGTPNALLQTDLAQQATVTIAPATLAPVVLFEGSFGTSSTQTITLTNTDTNASSLVQYEVPLPSHLACYPTEMQMCPHSLV